MAKEMEIICTVRGCLKRYFRASVVLFVIVSLFELTGESLFEPELQRTFLKVCLALAITAFTADGLAYLASFLLIYKKGIRPKRGKLMDVELEYRHRFCPFPNGCDVHRFEDGYFAVVLPVDEVQYCMYLLALTSDGRKAYTIAKSEPRRGYSYLWECRYGDEYYLISTRFLTDRRRAGRNDDGKYTPENH